MAKKKNNDINFAPRGIGDEKDGAVQKGVDLPSPTRKKHKSLGLSEDDLKAMFEQMYLQRRFEERAVDFCTCILVRRLFLPEQYLH